MEAELKWRSAMFTPSNHRKDGKRPSFMLQLLTLDLSKGLWSLGKKSEIPTLKWIFWLNIENKLLSLDA